MNKKEEKKRLKKKMENLRKRWSISFEKNTRRSKQGIEKKETKDTQWKRRKNFSWKNEIYKKTCKQQKREQTKEKKKKRNNKMLVFEGKKKNRQREWKVFKGVFFYKKKTRREKLKKKPKKKRKTSGNQTRTGRRWIFEKRVQTKRLQKRRENKN